MKNGKYMDVLPGYTSSILQDTESYLRKQDDSIEDDTRLVLNENNSSFSMFELQLGIYIANDVSDVLSRILQPDYEGFHNAIEIELDDITMKIKLVVRPSAIAIRFDEE